MKDFRAYVYSKEMAFGNIPVEVSVAFRHITCESEDEARTLAKLLVRAFSLFPKDAEILTAIASENKPDSDEPEQEEG